MFFIKKNLELISLWIIFIISFVFIYSEAYKNIKVDYIKETVLAFMAAAVTILITALLLRQQTTSEELKDTHSEIFKKKFDVYEEFFQNIMRLYDDKDNKSENLLNMEESFYKLLLFIQNKESFEIAYSIVLDSLQNKSRKNIGDLIFVLRGDLGILEEQHRDKHFCHNLDKRMNMLTVVAEKSRKSTT